MDVEDSRLQKSKIKWKYLYFKYNWRRTNGFYGFDDSLSSCTVIKCRFRKASDIYFTTIHIRVKIKIHSWP